MHVFVDESERTSYLVCAVFVAPAELHGVRRLMRQSLRPGERRIHFVKEQPSRRRLLLSALGTTSLRARIYSATGPAPAARHACIEQLVQDLGSREGGCTRLVIESRDGRDEQDRHTIFTSLRAGQGPADLSYEHFRPHEEPLLWPADAICWAYGAGGDWRRRVDPLLEKVTELDCD